MEYTCGLEEREKLETNEQLRHRADQNLEEELEIVAISIETNNGSEEISDIPKNSIKRGSWWINS